MPVKQSIIVLIDLFLKCFVISNQIIAIMKSLVKIFWFGTTWIASWRAVQCFPVGALTIIESRFQFQPEWIIVRPVAGGLPLPTRAAASGTGWNCCNGQTLDAGDR